MTREGLIKHWDVICAFKDGERIQFKNATMDYWDDCGRPDFSETVEYRIKPEPQEWWEARRRQGDRTLPSERYSSEKEVRYLIEDALPEEEFIVVHVREVTE